MPWGLGALQRIAGAPARRVNEKAREKNPPGLWTQNPLLRSAIRAHAPVVRACARVTSVQLRRSAVATVPSSVAVLDEALHHSLSAIDLAPLAPPLREHPSGGQSVAGSRGAEPISRLTAREARVLDELDAHHELLAAIKNREPPVRAPVPCRDMVRCPEPVEVPAPHANDRTAARAAARPRGAGLRPEQRQGNQLCPYPGTVLYRRLAAEGRLTDPGGDCASTTRRRDRTSCRDG